MMTLIRLTILTITLLLSLSAFADQLRIKFSCTLPSDNIDCEPIASKLFENGAILRVSGDETHDLIINIENQNTNDGKTYIFTFTPGEDVIPNIPINYPINNPISDSVTTDIKLTKIVNAINQALNLYLYACSSEGEAPTNTNWYIAPGVFGSYSAQRGNSNISIHGSNEMNYSDDNYHLIGNIGGMYSKGNSKPNMLDPYGSETKNSAIFAGGGIIRKIKGNWNAGPIVNANRVNSEFAYINQPDGEPLPELALNNSATRLQAEAGIEWILHPFTTTNNGNIAARYMIGYEWNNYVDPELYQQVNNNFARHRIQLVLSKYYEQIELATTITAVTKLATFDYTGLNGLLSVTWKATPKIKVGMNCGIAYAKGEIPSACHGSSFKDLTNGDESNLKTNVSFSVRWVIGNGEGKAMTDNRFMNRN